MTSRSAFVNVYGDRKDYALFEEARDGVDMVGVCGSNPHAPTISYLTPHIDGFRSATSGPQPYRLSVVIFCAAIQSHCLGSGG